MSAVRFEQSAHYGPFGAFPLVKGYLWSGAGSNRRPSAFQVNHAKRCADLQKRTSLTSETALGGRCKFHASKARYTPSTRQGSDPTQAMGKGVVSEDQAEPIAHAFGTAPSTKFTLRAVGGAR
jgi:hypothetical protein